MTCCQACPERNIQYNRTANLCAIALLIGLLLAHHGRANLGRIAQQKLLTQLAHQAPQPAVAAGCFQANPYLTVRQGAVKLRRLQRVVQAPFATLASLLVEEGDLSKVCRGD